MRVAYILARAPFAQQEQFVLEEAVELLAAGVDVRLFPLRPGRRPLPGQPAQIVERTDRRRAFAPTTLATAAGELARHPRTAAAAVRALVAANGNEPRLQPALRNGFVLPKTAQVTAALRRWRPDHIHAHFAASTATAAMIAARALGVPWSFTAHSPTDISKRNLMTAKAREAEFVRTISEDGRRRVRAALPPELGERVRVVPMGVRAAPGHARAPPSEPAFVRADGAPSVLCVGRLIPAKGQSLLIDAVARLRSEGVEVTCHIVGDGEDRAALAAQAQERGVERAVRLHGYLENARLLRVLDAGLVDVVVLPSDSEGVPVTLMEAMARGVRVVATDVGGVSELVVDGSGRLVPPRDVAALAAAMRAEIESPASGAPGREVVASRYCLSRNVARLAALFRGESAGDRSTV